MWVDVRNFAGKGSDPDVVHRVFSPAGGAYDLLSVDPIAACRTSPRLVLAGGGHFYVAWSQAVPDAGQSICRPGADDRDVYVFVR